MISFEEFYACCSCEKWAKKMAALKLKSGNEILEKAAEFWEQCNENDWLEAFAGHPMIGNIESLREKYQSTQILASSEQSACQQASEQTLKELALANDKYYQQNGFIFIICATGKSADEMLTALKERLKNERKIEINIAAAEQLKITKLRLGKLL